MQGGFKGYQNVLGVLQGILEALLRTSGVSGDSMDIRGHWGGIMGLQGASGTFPGVSRKVARDFRGVSRESHWVSGRSRDLRGASVLRGLS